MTQVDNVFLGEPIAALSRGNSYFKRISIPPGIMTWTELTILGKGNLSHLAQEARKIEKDLTARIRQEIQLVELLENKSGDDFKSLAKRFENPVNIKTKTGYDGIVEPTDITSFARPAGTTTFNVCGWCKYIERFGWCMANVNLTPRCTLTSPQYRAKRFDSLCVLHTKSAEEISKYVRNHRRKIKVLLRWRENVRRATRIFRQLAQTAPVRPLLPLFRPESHFKEGDEVVAYVGGWPKRLVKEEWVPGRLIRPWRDGGVTFRSPVQLQASSEYLNGFGADGAVSWPYVMKLEEFAYFRGLVEQNDTEGLEFLGIWLRSVIHKPFELKQFLNDLLHGHLLKVLPA